MTEKQAIDLGDFDFGFTLMDAEELDVVQVAQREITEAESTAEAWQAQAEQWQQKAQLIHRAIQPLLNNLSGDREKEYIYWPGDDRVAKINAFKLKLLSILED